MSRLRLRDLPESMRHEARGLLGSMNPATQGPSWSFICPDKQAGSWWFGLRRDSFTGPVPTLRSTFWCFGFDKRTPFSFRASAVDDTKIAIVRGFEITSRFISKARMGFCKDELIYVIREEIKYDWA